MTCIFEVTIFELFFRGLLRRRYSSPIFYIAIYIGVVSLIYGINSLGNSKLNLIANILIYYAVYSLLYEEELKERVKEIDLAYTELGYSLEKAKEKYSFILPFNQNISLKEHLEKYKKQVSAREKKTLKLFKKQEKKENKNKR